MALIVGKDIFRDGQGVSDLEVELKRRIREGERMIDAKYVDFLLNELSDLRSQMHYHGAYSNGIKRLENDIEDGKKDLAFINELKRKVLK